MSGMLAVALTRILVKPHGEYSLLVAMIFWMYQKPFPSYVQSYFTTYGPLLAVLIPSAGTIKKYLTSDKFNLYYLILICILAWGIGSDTDRSPVLGNASLVHYVWHCPRSLVANLQPRWGLLVALLIVQCLAQRSFVPYPEYAPEKVVYRIPLLTVICNDGCGLDPPSYNGRIGSGLDAATCTPTPCLQNGNPYYLQLFLFIENVLAVGVFAYLLIRAQNGNIFLLLRGKIKLMENNRLELTDLDQNHILEHTRELWDELRGQRIFITGGTGFFGCWLLESFIWANEKLNLNAHATVLTRSPNAFRVKAPHLAGNKAVTLLSGDVRTFDFPKGTFSHIIHASSETNPVNAPLPSNLLFQANVKGTIKALELSQQCSAKKFLFTSSGAVYGKQPPEITHLPEDYAGAPLTIDSYQCVRTRQTSLGIPLCDHCNT